MGSAEATYVDPSALTKLYLHENGSREIFAWRRRNEGALWVTHHGRTEVINAICIASFLGDLDETERSQAISNFSDDFLEGHLKQADLLWRSALNRAAELSQQFTPKLGTRTLDVLHVASALELELRYFLSWDIRQKRLASAAGLKVIEL